MSSVYLHFIFLSFYDEQKDGLDSTTKVVLSSTLTTMQ